VPVEFGDRCVFAVGYAALVIRLSPLEAVPDRDGAGLGTVCLSCLERAGIELQAAGIFASAALDGAFKLCCLRSGRYDGAVRNYYF
jgi:hypothetical protein